MGAYGRVRFVLLCTVYILKLASYDNIVIAFTISPSGQSSMALSSNTVVNVPVTSAVEVSSAISTTERFSSVATSVESPGPTVTVGTLILVQASPSATTTGSSGAASFAAAVLPSEPVSVEPTPASTVIPTITSSVNGQCFVALSSNTVVNVPVSSAVEVSGAMTRKEGFSSVKTPVQSPGPTIAVGSLKRTLILVQASPSATTTGSSGAASFASAVLPSEPVLVEPTPASTVIPTTTSSVNGQSFVALSSNTVVNVPVSSAVEVSGAMTRNERFSSVKTPVQSPGPTIAVGSLKRTLILVQASPSATTTGSSGAAPFPSAILPSEPVSVEPTAASTVKPTTTSSVNAYTCPALTVPSNGIKFGCPENANLDNDTVCQFSCYDGYIGSGSQARTCQKNGTWSGQEFTCQTVTCAMLPLPTNSKLLGCSKTDMLYGTVCRFSCNEGFEAKGSTIRRCTEYGTWSGTDLVCSGISGAVEAHGEEHL